MKQIIAALRERGYDPYAQLTGYVVEKSPVYITSYNNARSLIQTLDFEQVKRYVEGMQNETAI